MTLEEALRELGIEATASPEEARRAYLRGVKVRKPETDPEGFRRLREAYEIVTGALSQPQMEPGPPRDEEEDEDEVPPELATLAARLRGLPAETRLEERLAALREAVREHPRSLGVRWWLIQELGRAGRREELLEAIRQGEAEGLPGFLEARALNFPDSVGPEDLFRLETSGSPEILALAARVYLAGSRYGEAAAALGRALDRLAEWEDPVSQPFPGWLPRGILALEAAGRAAEARALHDRLWSWLSGTGDAALLKRWGEDFFWRILHELGKLDPKFPARLRQAAAQAALEGDLRKAIPAVDEFAQADSRRAEEASALLYDLPILYSCFFRPLQQIKPAAPRPAATDGGYNWLISLALFALFALLRSCGGSDYPGPVTQPVSAPPSSMAIQAWQAWDLLGGACDLARPKLPPKACDAARLAVLKARDGDCKGAHAALDDMNAQMQGFSAPDLSKPKAFQAQMLSALDGGCGSYQLGPEGRASP